MEADPLKVDVKLSANGRICIPADVRQQLGLKDGDTLSLELTDHGIILTTFAQRVREVQASFAHLRDQLPTVDEFIQERREEARREEEKDRRLYGD